MEKSIKNYSDYSVSRDGLVVIQISTGRILTQSTAKHGYKSVYIKSDDGKFSNQRVHRLVVAQYNELDLFWVPAVNHIDGNPKNNSLENLELCTRSQNATLPRHTSKKGRDLPKGIHHWKIGKKKYRVSLKHVKAYITAYFLTLDEAIDFYVKTFLRLYEVHPYSENKSISIRK